MFSQYLSKFGIKIVPENEILYKMAFVHNSYANEKKLEYSYQRLEFLGDAVLQQESSYYLYKAYPQKNEGVITEYRSIIVRKDTLALVSKNLKLNSLILLGKGEIKSRGYKNDNILADVVESFIAAIFLDKGQEFVRKFIKDNIIDFVQSNNMLETVKDYKTELQEKLQAESKSTPEYKIIKEERIIKANQSNNKILYTSIILSDGLKYGVGSGFSIKQAEQNAAKNALVKLASK